MQELIEIEEEIKTINRSRNDSSTADFISEEEKNRPEDSIEVARMNTNTTIDLENSKLKMRRTLSNESNFIRGIKYHAKRLNLVKAAFLDSYTHEMTARWLEGGFNLCIIFFIIFIGAIAMAYVRLDFFVCYFFVNFNMFL